MARGWESKSVEEQIELAAERAKGIKAEKKISDEEAARQREIDTIQLDRTRVAHDLAMATNPRYREQLQRSLEFLDQKLARAAGQH